MTSLSTTGVGLAGARILLTGGAGYIGSHTFAELAAAGAEVVVLDNFSNCSREVPGRLAALTGVPELEVVEGSVLDPAFLAEVFSRHRFDAVVHFAAQKAVGESMERPVDYFATNCGGLACLLQAMEAAQVWRLVFSSSATVYGVPEVLPITETASTGYANPYGFTKLTCEHLLAQAAAADPRWAFGVLRYFNPVGAHPSGLIGEAPDGVPDNLMPFLARVAAGTLRELTVFGDDYPTRDGTGVRDYIHVSDLAAGHVLSLGRLMESGEGHVVNLGTGRGHTVLEVVEAYGAACGRALPFRIGPRRPGDVAELYADPSRARELLGFEASRDLSEMCATSWNWIRQRNVSGADLAAGGE